MKLHLNNKGIWRGRYCPGARARHGIYHHKRLVPQGFHQTKGCIYMVSSSISRQDSCHTNVWSKACIPAIQTHLDLSHSHEGLWDQMLRKLSDTKFTFKSHSCLWSIDIHEPLTIVFVAPLLSRAPWKLAKHPFLVKWESTLFDMQHKYTRDVRDQMRKFWVLRVLGKVMQV